MLLLQKVRQNLSEIIRGRGLKKVKDRCPRTIREAVSLACDHVAKSATSDICIVLSVPRVIFHWRTY